MRGVALGEEFDEARESILRTLDRYIFREVAMSWIGVTGVLLVILLANQLARVLSQAASNGFPREVVFALIGLTAAGNLSLIMPIGFFLAIILGLGRLYHESEMAAIQSCGVGPAGLYRPISLLAALIVVLLAWLSFIGIPAASARAQEIRNLAIREARFGSLEPGRFRAFGGGVVFYAESIDANGVLHNVNVFVDRPEETDGKTQTTSKTATSKQAGDKNKTEKPEHRLEIWVAARAEQRGAGQAEQTFVLYDGERYEGVPGEGAFRVIKFSEGGIPINLGDTSTGASKAEMKPTAALLRSADPVDQAELHWRIATPLCTVVLMILAVPLARLRPRQGRFGKIGLAMLAYFVYFEVMTGARTMIEGGVLPPAVGLWWVHAIAGFAGFWLLTRESPPARVRRVRGAGMPQGQG